MLGAITGDIIGSVYEFRPTKTTDFPLFSPFSQFTDDTVLTIATAEAVLNDEAYAAVYRRYCRRYPKAGYGGAFLQWALSESSAPYGSWGNGSAMRVSPIGYAFETLSNVMEQAAASASVTHNHPAAVRGAQAVAATVFLARTGSSKADIHDFVQSEFGYNLDRTLADMRPSYRFDVSCAGTVPPAIQAFLESTDYESAVRNAVSLGGDSDTLACIAGSLAEAFYGEVPENCLTPVFARLDADMIRTIYAFTKRFCMRT